VHDSAKRPVVSHTTVLLVDDIDDDRLTTKWFLASFGYSVESVRSVEEALALFDSKTHDIVVTDNSMPTMSGVEMAQVIKLRSASTPVLLYTRVAPENLSCVDRIIFKPAHLLELKEAIDVLLSRRARRQIRLQ
jgi:CheY-like chemotaxis protein